MRFQKVILVALVLLLSCCTFCESHEFRCLDDEETVLDFFVCDGDNDCDDGSDEKICQCNLNETIKCETNEKANCIFKSRMCDGVKDCADNSDEQDCHCPGFKCTNGVCLKELHFVCDGQDDCGDGSDELGCASDNCTLDKNFFKCRDGVTCLPLDKVCDLKNDCPDSSDEGRRCFVRCGRGACENGRCKELPTGPRCLCNKGFNTIRSESSVCHDIDECMGNHDCPQVCQNTHGGYECSCLNGYTYQASNNTCLLKVSPVVRMFFATADKLGAWEFTTGNERILKTDVQDVHAIAADDQYLYFGETGAQSKVSRMKYNDSASSVVESLSVRSMGVIEGLAVDWYTGNVYYTDSQSKEIVVLGDAPHKSVAVIRTGLDKPRGIVVDPAHGKMFWSDWGKTPQIGVAQMDGEGQRTFFSNNIRWPNGLSIDYITSRLYFVDSYYNKMVSMHIGGLGSVKEITFIGSDSSPINLQVVDGTIYWTERDNNLIRKIRTDHFGGPDKITVMDHFKSFYVYSSLVHTAPEDEKNPCKKDPCPYMCLLSGSGSRSCVSGETKQIVHGSIYKIPLRKEVLVGHQHKLYRVGFRGNSTTPDVSDFHKVKMGNYTISKMTYSTISGDIFVADNEQRKILKVVPHSIKEVVEVQTEDIGKISSIAVHPKVENLFWTDSGRRTLEVYSLVNNLQATLIRFSSTQIPLAVGFGQRNSQTLVLTRNGTALEMIWVKVNAEKSIHPLRTRITGEPNVQLVVSDADSLVYLMIGPRVVTWNYVTMDEREISLDLPPNVSHLMYRPESGEFIATRQEGTVYWGKQNIHIVPASALQGTVKDVPLMAYSAHLNEANQMDICISDNGGCSDICMYMARDIMEVMHMWHCYCGNGRKLEMIYKCHPDPDCDFRCEDGVCLNKVDLCDGIKNCEGGEDELSCSRANTTHYTMHRNDPLFRILEKSTEKEQKCTEGTVVRSPWTVLIACLIGGIVVAACSF